MTFTERLLAKHVVVDECWIWTAARSTNGYGLMDDDEGRTRRAHRLTYEALVGPIPEGLELDHLCRQRLCVNPDHLEPVTHAENMRRAKSHWTPKTHCPQGHPYDSDNTVVVTTSKGTERRCRTCKRDQLRAWRQRSG